LNGAEKGPDKLLCGLDQCEALGRNGRLVTLVRRRQVVGPEALIAADNEPDGVANILVALFDGLEASDHFLAYFGVVGRDAFGGRRQLVQELNTVLSDERDVYGLGLLHELGGGVFAALVDFGPSGLHSGFPLGKKIGVGLADLTGLGGTLNLSLVCPVGFVDGLDRIVRRLVHLGGMAVSALYLGGQLAALLDEGRVTLEREGLVGATVKGTPLCLLVEHVSPI
jgi:hypothetical protein